jgi:hypothetical protein
MGAGTVVPEAVPPAGAAAPALALASVGTATAKVTARTVTFASRPNTDPGRVVVVVMPIVLPRIAAAAP